MAKETEKTPAATTGRTRGGWEPTGTAAARRANRDEGGTTRGERTRRDIMAAARRVFERDGYLDARVADIVKEAGVAHGSFYTYFPSKREVFREVTGEVGALIHDAVSQVPSEHHGDTFGSLKKSNEQYLNVYRQNHKMMALIEQVATVDAEIHAFRLQRRRHHVNRVARTIRRWQEEGLADPTIDPNTTAGALVAMLSNFAYWWLAGGDTYDDDVAATTLTEIWARAVGLKVPSDNTGTTRRVRPARRPAKRAAS